MKIAGIIAEFNPFHNGHVVPIEAARATVGTEGAVVCVMSGNCVQRGDLAVFHKSARAHAAVAAGADLVVELPAPYVLGSAEPFARGGVALLSAIGASELVFGCETASRDALAYVAEALDTPEVQNTIRAKMTEGLPYGAACQSALNECEVVGNVLRSPNNLLGIEYIRAIRYSGVDMRPLPVHRQGVGHHSSTPAEGYASATYLRNLLFDGTEPWDYMPDAAAGIFRREQQMGRGPAGAARIEAVMLALLRLQAPPATGYLDDSEGLSTRIRNAASRAGSLAELWEGAKTKRYHLSRIRRLTLSMCLGLTPSDRPAMPPYIRPLATNETGRGLLRRLTKVTTTPIISRAGDAKTLGTAAARMIEIEAAVTDLQALCFQETALRRGGSEWKIVPNLT
ncbi:MAG: nucleotidyltransferase family protein [Oscillospiraceae bacterium]|nr:nucleotidyltransferase family protein [Oscillospiraceae bacterium]